MVAISDFRVIHAKLLRPDFPKKTFSGERAKILKYQILKIPNQVTNCSLSKIGQLPFIFWAGACTVSKDEVYLCFDGLWLKPPSKPGDLRTCWKSSDAVSNWTKIEYSIYEHRSIKIAATDCK